MDELGWAGRVMIMLRYATQLVAVNLLWVLGTLAGGVVLGAFPASRAAARLLEALRRRTPSQSLLRDFWDGYRTDFLRTNLLGVPFWVIGALALVDLQVFRAAADAGERGATLLLVPFVVVLAVTGVALAFLLAVLLRFRDGARATWRFVFVAPFLSPGTAVTMVLALLAFTVLTWQWPVLVPLVGFSGPLFIATWLAGRRVETLTGDGELLADPLLTPDEPADDVSSASDGPR